MNRYFIFILAVLASACGQHPIPEYIWVPGPEYSSTLDIRAEDDTLAVGQQTVMHASRKSDGFITVKSDPDSMPENWWRREPPLDEPEVADNLRWIVSPEGHHEFNLGLRKDHTRVLKFKKSGTYTITARSAVWGDTATHSDTIRIVVRER